jgi:hypothetical protein
MTPLVAHIVTIVVLLAVVPSVWAMFETGAAAR